MSEIIRKILVGDLFYIQEYEEYFSEMSKRGLHLQKIGTFFAYFRKGEPQFLNYRIDIVKQNEKETVIEKHKQEGWNFVGGRDKFLIFCSQKGSNLKELYENPEKQRLALSAAKDELLGGKLINIILILLTIAIIYGKINLAGGFYLSLTSISSVLMFLTVVLISFFRSNREKWELGKIEKILDSGEFLRHQGDYSLMKRRYIIRKVVLFIVIIILFYKAYQSKKIDIDEIGILESLPMVTIADIERMDYRPDRSGTFIKDDDFDYGNIIYKGWNILIPEDISLIQTVILYDENQKPTKYKPQLIVDYYHTRFDFIARGLEQDILSRENDRYTSELREIKREQDFSCYGVEKKDSIVLLYRKGKEVTFINYHDGRVSLEELMKNIEINIGPRH